MSRKMDKTKYHPVIILPIKNFNGVNADATATMRLQNGSLLPFHSIPLSLGNTNIFLTETFPMECAANTLIFFFKKCLLFQYFPPTQKITFCERRKIIESIEFFLFH